MKLDEKEMDGMNSGLEGRSGDLYISGDKYNIQESSFLESFGNYMKIRMQLDEVRADPAINEIEAEIKEQVLDYNIHKTDESDNRKFITEYFRMAEEDSKISQRIEDEGCRITRSQINDLTAEWVKEWHEKRKNSVRGNKVSDEVRSFITGSLEEPSTAYVKVDNKITSRKGFTSSTVVRYISLSAAALVVCLLLVRTLLPSTDPEKLFSEYYTPFNVISSVTRSGNSMNPGKNSLAVEKYRSGEYSAALAGFTDQLSTDTSSISAHFFLGITHLALGDCKNAITRLSSVSETPGSLRKDAIWYLGLAYLKSGEKGNAQNCFELLAGSPGYYSTRAEKLLRRLK